MKRTNIYILLAIICCVGCNNTIDLDNQVISSPKAKVETLSYKDLLNNDSPLLTVIDIKNCNNEDSLRYLLCIQKTGMTTLMLAC